MRSSIVAAALAFAIQQTYASSVYVLSALGQVLFLRECEHMLIRTLTLHSFISAFKGACTKVGTYASDDHADFSTSASGDMGCYRFGADIESFRGWQLEENNKKIVAWGDDECLSTKNMIEVTVSKQCYTAPEDVSANHRLEEFEVHGV